LWCFFVVQSVGAALPSIFPFHINNVRQASAQVIQRINQASQGNSKTELGSPQAQAELEGSRTIPKQVSDLLQNEQRLNQALQSDQLESQKNYYSGLRPIRKHLTSFSSNSVHNHFETKL